jgi:nitrogen-specific signal transduction histidine kinase
MPGAGKLHFQTSRHNNFPALREVAGELPRLPAACLTLADSGNGLNRKPFTILSEPFPLTRESGNGTGFNFHRARLFLENSRGALSAESSPGTGTTIRLWLPQADFTEAEQANAPAGATL